MPALPSNDDLRVFIAVARKASFVAVADALGVSPAYVTKRVRVLEAQLGVRLLDRSTRRVVVTEDGERVYEWAERVLDDVDQLLQATRAARGTPRGTLRISSSFGFGRRVVAPLIVRLVARYPELQVRFDVFDRLVDVAGEGFDLDVRVGDEIAPNLRARRLASNERVLCAAPDYLARRGVPETPADLAEHDCLVIKERDHPFGVWRLLRRGQPQTVKVTGPLATNNGEIAVQWALQGQGVVLRSRWDVDAMLADGRLCRVLPDYAQPANIWAVYPARLEQSARLRVCVAFLEAAFAGRAGAAVDA